MTGEIQCNIVQDSVLSTEEWDNFLGTVPDATYFCTSDYWRSYKNSYFLQSRDPEGNLISGVPFCIQSEIPVFGNYFKFCRLESSLLVSSVLDKDEIIKLKKHNYELLIDHIRKKGVVFLFISSKSRSKDGKLLSEMGFNVDLGATFIINLSNSLENIFKSFSKGNKAAIQNARKAGVSVEILEGEKAIKQLPDYFRLQQELIKRKGRNLSSIYIKSESFIGNILSSKSNKSFLAMAWHNEQPASGAVLITFKKVIYYYLGATDYSITNKIQASNLLQYEIIKFGKASGYEIYDLGGVPVNPVPNLNTYGVYKFKKSFGGEHCLYDTGIYIFRKFRYRLMKKMIRYEHNFLVSAIYNFLRK